MRLQLRPHWCSAAADFPAAVYSALCASKWSSRIQLLRAQEDGVMGHHRRGAAAAAAAVLLAVAFAVPCTHAIEGFEGHPIHEVDVGAVQLRKLAQAKPSAGPVVADNATCAPVEAALLGGFEGGWRPGDQARGRRRMICAAHRTSGRRRYLPAQPGCVPLPQSWCDHPSTPCEQAHWSGSLSPSASLPSAM